MSTEVDALECSYKMVIKKEERHKRRRPSMQMIEGCPFPPKLAFYENNIRSALDYVPLDSDTFVVTYPKCGTTWLQYIIWDIIKMASQKPPNLNNMMSAMMPFLELVGKDVVEKTESPRFIKTHLSFSMNPKNGRAKYIYVARNPGDCCVSYYHFIKGNSVYRFEDATFDDFFECFVRGDVPFGDYFDHVMSWYEHKNDDNVLFLTYEGMQRNHEGSILEVARFLGEEFHRPIVNDPNLLQKIRERTSFEAMKGYTFYRPYTHRAASMVNDLNGRYPDEDVLQGFRKINFFRKGVVGDWKSYMSQKQLHALNERMANKLKNTELYKLWTSI